MQNYSDSQGLNLKKLVFQNTSAMLFARIVGLFFSLFASIFLVRYLGNERFGRYSSLYAYISLFSWLTTLGMDQVLIKEASQSEGRARQIISTGMISAVCLSVAAVIVAMASAPFLGYLGNLWLLLLFAVADLLLLAPLRLASVAFTINLKQWQNAIIFIGRQLLWCVAIGLFVLFRVNLSVVILGRFACSFLEALFIFLFARRLIFFRWQWDKVLARDIFQKSFPLALSGLGICIYMRVDQVLLHAWTGDKELGYYAASVNVAELFTIFVTALTTTMLPVLSRVSLDLERFERYFSLSFRYLMPFIFGVCALLTVNSALLIKIFYGKGYASSAPVLSVLIWSEVGGYFGTIISIGLIAKGLQKYIPVTTLLGALLNLVLNCLFIPKWGVMGAAWATVLSYNFSSIVLFFVFSRTRNFAFTGLKASLLPFAAALLLVAVLYSTPGIVYNGLVIILYISILFIFKYWNKNDLRLITEILFKSNKLNEKLQPA
ncbi:MAG: flippase [Candidatus Omnitrophota bacterium]|nr:flippase [Candidatus Omnitrophota bacterium]